MEVELSFNEETRTEELKLCGNLQVQHADELKKVLMGTFDKADTTLLDLRDVESFDLSAIQLLYAFHLASINADKTFSLLGDCPITFRQAVENAGLSWANWLCFGKNQD